MVKPEVVSLLKSKSISHKIIIQTYLSFNPELRIRSIYENGKLKYTQAAKSKKKVGKKEKEFPIKASTYKDLYKNRESGDLNKTRYNILLKEYTGQELLAEMDVYIGFDFVIVEVEFKNETDMKNFIIPEWFGKEVTNNNKYSNKSLAKKIPLKY